MNTFKNSSSFLAAVLLLPLSGAQAAPRCANMWRESVRALNKHLADNTDTGLWYGQVDMETGKRTATEWGSLHAFLPAVLTLGGDLGRARRLQASSYKMWNLKGIEPEVIDYRRMKIKEPGYPLRPEIMESAYYLYHDTKDPQYQEMGRRFSSISAPDAVPTPAIRC